MDLEITILLEKLYFIGIGQANIHIGLKKPIHSDMVKYTGIVTACDEPIGFWLSSVKESLTTKITEAISHGTHGTHGTARSPPLTFGHSVYVPFIGYMKLEDAERTLEKEFHFFYYRSMPTSLAKAHSFLGRILFDILRFRTPCSKCRSPTITIDEIVNPLDTIGIQDLLQVGEYHTSNHIYTCTLGTVWQSGTAVFSSDLRVRPNTWTILCLKLVNEEHSCILVNSRK
ncbi:hypothetical protein NQ317_001938 [Molorchus minor]|uniref:Uncharacterized protein n=1 Tax=Molorchus minor TaxID=1323400 RepID=A0ABQ9JCP3_9CUCU|nr:hypothetical protein NQ317_001938 [Molorchus minor]